MMSIYFRWLVVESPLSLFLMFLRKLFYYTYDYMIALALITYFINWLYMMVVYSVAL